MRKPTNKNQARELSKAITSEIWNRVIVRHNGDFSNRASMDEMYLAEVLKLPTNDLKFIVKCNEKGIFGRSQNTIDAITTELLERALRNTKTPPDLDEFFEFMEGYKDEQEENKTNGADNARDGKSTDGDGG